jgi:resuscitation-promoting factor RpfB
VRKEEVRLMLVLLPYVAAVLLRPDTDAATRSEQRPALHALRWDLLADCESGGDPTTDTGNGYYGMYQFDLGTWAGVGGHGLPSAASAAEQTMRAELLYNERGPAPWPQCGWRLAS